MHNKKVLPFEKPLFLSCITFIGGYMNAYTYITRNQILANMHTANISKLGIKLALGQFKNALSFFIETSLKNLIIFTVVTFSFVFGAFVGSLISIHVGATSVWFCSFLLLIETFYMYEYELKNKDDF